MGWRVWEGGGGGSTSRIRETLRRRQIPAVFFQNVRLQGASKSTITVLINHMAGVLAQIDARVVIKAQTSQRQGRDLTPILTTSSALGRCERQCEISKKQNVQN